MWYGEGTSHCFTNVNKPSKKIIALILCYKQEYMKNSSASFAITESNNHELLHDALNTFLED
jgi:hypothetical protein